MFQEEPNGSHSLPQIEQSAFINLDDELLMAAQNNQNPMLMTSMVGGVSQNNETNMFDEDF